MFTQRNYFEQLKNSNPGRLVAPSYLRLERTINSSFNSIDFYTREGEGTQLVTERRLKSQMHLQLQKLGFLSQRLEAPQLQQMHNYQALI